jgi:hypothetical protein
LIVRWRGRVQAGAKVTGLVGVTWIGELLGAAAGLAPSAEVLVSPLGAREPDAEVVVYTPGQQARRHVGPPRPRLSAQARQAAAIRVDGGKLVRHGEGPVQYFDLRSDPGELSPLPVPESLAAARERLLSVLAVEPRAPTDEERARLQALGYVE